MTTLHDQSHRDASCGPTAGAPELIAMSGSTTSLGRACEPTLRIETLLDPVVDQIGHDPRSCYVETYWLPVLGPSTTWLLRRFATYLDEVPAGVVLDTEELARGLGLGERYGPNAPFARTVKRCVDFQMAEWRDSSLAVRRHLPPLARRHLRRLPESLQERHTAEVESARPSNVTDRLRLHGRRLALSLLDYGEDRAAVEQQLMRWAFHPALAAECSAWAALEQARRRVSQAAHPAHGEAARGEPATVPGPAAHPRAAQSQPHVQIRT